MWFLALMCRLYLAPEFFVARTGRYTEDYKLIHPVRPLQSTNCGDKTLIYDFSMQTLGKNHELTLPIQSLRVGFLWSSVTLWIIRYGPQPDFTGGALFLNLCWTFSIGIYHHFQRLNPIIIALKSFQSRLFLC